MRARAIQPGGCGFPRCSPKARAGCMDGPFVLRMDGDARRPWRPLRTQSAPSEHAFRKPLIAHLHSAHARPIATGDGPA